MQNYNRIEKYDWKTCYYLNDKYHRIDGPAVELIDGYKAWYQNGILHRLDGHAEECPDGTKYWFYEGIGTDCNSQEEFEKYLKLKLFW